MSAAVVVPIVVAVITGFGATGLAALVLVPKQRQQMDASSTYQLTQSVVMASQELENLRGKVRQLSADLDEERTLRLVAESRLRAWAAQGMAPYPPPPGPPAPRDVLPPKEEQP